MYIYGSLLLFCVAVYILGLGIKVWKNNYASMQNFPFLCVSAATFIWAGSQALLMVCPPAHRSVFVSGSAFGATMFGAFIFLFILGFSGETPFYRGACMVLPVLGLVSWGIREVGEGAALAETSWGVFYRGRDCAANYLYYAFLCVLAFATFVILFLYALYAPLRRQRICLGSWLVMFFILGTGTIGIELYWMKEGIAVSPLEGLLGCLVTAGLYYTSEYTELLNISDARLREYMTSHFTTPVVFVDQEGEITYYNKCYREFFGLSGKLMGTKNFYPNLVTERSLEEAIGYVKDNNITQGSFKATTLDGSRILDIKFTLLYDKFGDVRHVINIINDVTEEEALLKDLEQQTAFAQQQTALAEEQTALAEEQSHLAEENRLAAVRANEAKSEFLANMSHEIRTPLNAIIGMNEMVMREEISPQAQKYAQNIYNAGQTLLAIINDILDFSKIESGKMEIVPVTYELSSVLNDVVNMVTQKVHDKGLSFITDVASDIPYQLFGDEVRIRQIMLNIVNNAVKYTQKGSVTLRMDWEWIDEVKMLLKLSVEDTGIGIKEEDLRKLFKGFQRVDLAANRNVEGTGLGLAITKRLVEQMDGTITVESVYHQGSVFTVTLPQVVMNDRPMGDFENAYQKMHKNRVAETEHFTAPEARMLIVDDNRVNLAVAKGLVKNTMIQMDTAESGMEALEKVRTNRYHIILLDHMMPEMNGLETIKLMREQEENMSRDAAVIALTANAISGSREMYMAAGFNDYLSKPIDVIKYTEIIRKYLPQELIHEQDT
ncbi:MAG: ATP-binding protein [Clostridiales bacterium]|nr:ATP-binding protein [Clostridiales bacterium]